MTDKTPEARERHRLYMQEWRARNPEKAAEIASRGRQVQYATHPERRAAVRAVGRSIRNGTMVRPPECSECGASGKVEAHHHLGYAVEHRRDVLWLCRDCHLQDHRRTA